MTQIDTSKWGKFKVGDLFDVANGKKYPSNIRQTGELPLISTTANNNGISDYIKDRNDGVYSNCITVAYSGSVGATFYHKEKVFVGETVIALLPKFKMNQYSGLFICSILSKINSKFSYTQKIKVLQYKNETIPLPITSDGTPDFDYMENYTKEITKLAAKRVEKLKEENAESKIDIKSWKKFKVGDLFEIKRSKNNINFERCNTGSTPLISAGNENNGIVGYIDKEDFEVFPANSITVNIFGKAFVQIKDFCASANVLIIKNEHLTKNIGLFIAAILSKKHSKYNYNDQINKDKLFNETIPLPITSDGTPDFDYMENYTKEITKLAAKRVEKLKEEKTETKIDTSNWKKFKVGELFETVNDNGKQVPTGANVPSLELKSGTAPRISVTGVNNGVVGYYDSTHKNYKVYNNFISVNFLGNAFYQENNASLDMKVHCLKLKNKELNKYLALFLVTIINKLTASYSYASQLSSTSITQLQLPLPITSEGAPDFDYMEDYMKNIEDCTNNIIEQAKIKIKEVKEICGR